MAEVFMTLILAISACFIGALALIWHFAIPAAIIVVIWFLFKEFTKEVKKEESKSSGEPKKGGEA